MPRIVQSRAREWDWVVVSADLPCAICSGTQGCHRNPTGYFARCARRQSEWPLVDGGWLHRTAPPAGSPRPTTAAQRESRTTDGWGRP